MGKITPDPLGDVVKELEAKYEQRVAEPGQFLMARADGRAFHTFTRDLKRPFDERMSDAMLYTTKNLCHEFGARLGYTQSDEITLAFHYPDGGPQDYPYGGRLQKMCSLIASMASVLFYSQISKSLPTKASETPVFDCRVFRAVTLQTAVDSFVWREKDAKKNAVSMAASAVYPPKQLEGVGTGERLRLLEEKLINFNDYPLHFRKGIYFHRQEREMKLDPALLIKIPEGKQPPNGMVVRRSVEQAKFSSLLELSENELKRLFGA